MSLDTAVDRALLLSQAPDWAPPGNRWRWYLGDPRAVPLGEAILVSIGRRGDG